ncbi:ethanolamine ammonia-lyase subunit EutC [Falsigemmobacter faecalis]|uniref:Ethanolamine ammonia-lyase small subunit n=1 Tax=Falsigemmobacter faecalis TaxID=2488730 RepID=A0A3P3DDI3_9RHOB|nr:ethanolamine ammonia-lyase subunit EutC [Falsigemmobacter faecalis]RRH72387.1 ethanolamine ammonia-lyase subunit EutC [Falsigemmobacter faecalis]
MSGLRPDPWQGLRQLTPARIALGRSLPTAEHLRFQLDHARARRAVHYPLPAAQMEQDLAGLGPPVLRLHSAAPDRSVYLQRPDLGRRLSEASAARLTPGEYDLALVVADGLSALAIEANAAAFLQSFLGHPAMAGLRIAPLTLVEQGRVAIGDEIAHRLGARQVAVLIGERPGLSSPDSMGIYFTHAPRPGLTDEARNCLSNIRAAGQSVQDAAARLAWLSVNARVRGLSGVALKLEALL